jgi:UDP-N-acetylglucosamine 4,6-dehydratase
MSSILITGGTGFLGKRLGRLLRDCEHHVVLGGRNNKQNLIAGQLTGLEVIPLDVTRMDSVRDAINYTKPDLIIHAAATKFVDLAEKYPLEAIDVNVLGSQNVARAAIDKGVPAVIGISTDKASPPIRNTYGLTKALMERAFAALDAQNGTRFVTVRYGNVAWSTASVLCVWRKMLREGGLIETTGPEMYRFFFTIEEAVDLVITAMQNIPELGGLTLSRPMKAAKMRRILEIWTRLAGGSYRVIAARPGDRTEEFLIGAAELNRCRTTDGSLPEPVSSRNAPQLTDEEIIALIQSVPEEEPAL